MHKRFYVNALVVFAVAVCLPAANSAQPTQSAPTPYLQAGMSALQFQIQDDLILRSFQGSTISFKRQTSPDRAYRFGLSLSFNFRDSDDLSSTEPGSSVIDATNDGQGINLTAQKLFYTRPSKRAAVYYGVGPTGGFSRTHQEEERIETTGQTRVLSNTRRSWSAGLAGALGVEWFASSTISFLAEYSTTALFSWQKSKDERILSDTQSGNTSSTRNESTTKSFEVRADAVKFGLAVYF